MGDCHNTGGDFTRAYAAAEKALSLDDRIAEAHTTRAHALMHMLRWAEAEAAFQRAIELDPSYPPARYVYAEYLVVRGRGTEAVQEALKAIVVDPLSAIAHHAAGVVSYYSGDYDGAMPYLRKALDIDPAHAFTHGRMAMVYERKLAFDEAIAAWLATGLRTRTYDIVYMKVDPRLEPLRSRPEFLAMLKEGGW